LFDVYVFVFVLSVAQKYMSFMLKPDEKLKVVTMKGLHHVDTRYIDGATYLNPDLHPGRHLLLCVPGNVFLQLLL